MLPDTKNESIMQFTIKDFARFLTNPLIPAFVIFFVQLFKKRQSRTVLFLLFFYLYAVTAPFSSKLAVRFWSIDDTISSSRTYDAVVVLTGMADANWYLDRRNSSFTPKCYYRFGKNIERIIAAAGLIRSGQVQKLLFGDLRSKSFSEAELVVDFLQNQGIVPGQIVIYGEVKNTLDEAVKAKKYMEQAGMKKFVLVTSENHMRRARAMFNDQGLYPDLLSVSKIKKPVIWTDFIPCKNGLSLTQGMLYEIEGFAGYIAKRKLTDFPEYLKLL